MYLYNYIVYKFQVFIYICTYIYGFKHTIILHMYVGMFALKVKVGWHSKECLKKQKKITHHLAYI